MSEQTMSKLKFSVCVCVGGGVTQTMSEWTMSKLKFSVGVCVCRG